MKKTLLIAGAIILIGIVIYLIMQNNAPLTSQAVEKDTTTDGQNSTITKPTLSAEERAHIEARIAKIEAEILETTNDPDRDLELRTELQTLKNQL